MMKLPKRYNPRTREPELEAWWQSTGVYHYAPEGEAPVYAIDTPPPTVSGRLHLGHCYSYSHTDFLARFWRMQGYNVFYPMGFDDNGLPTERLVERWRAITAGEAGREAFIAACREVSDEAVAAYTALWRRLGLSVDWRQTYRTSDAHSRRTAQASFLALLEKELVYRRQAPAIWCPECGTALAQADVDDLERKSEFVTVAFGLEEGGALPIATTRPELLPACVAIFVHPTDRRYAELLGKEARVPLFDRPVPILPDPAADPEKGTGAVMCCTFGDTTDVQWWYAHQLPLIPVIGSQGRLNDNAGPFAGLAVPEARAAIIDALREADLLLDRTPTIQTVGAHERCDTPVEYLVLRQWFIDVLNFKQELLQMGDQIQWEPKHMHNRFRQWVENLAWDWCISRQRAYGVPFPLWYCTECGEPIPADPAELPVDPRLDEPSRACPNCGATTFEPETDMFDTWATSSLSPRIAGELTAPPVPLPFALRPQAHEIIRTWAFYTLVMAHHHESGLPWRTIALSGWGLAPEGTKKISKSRGGGPLAPEEMMALYSADAVRYWASGTGLGKDARISEEKIQAGQKLVTKLWNVARFCARFLPGESPSRPDETDLTTADRWLLARLAQVIGEATGRFLAYDYAGARQAAEIFFWRDLADNYLEMAKQRLYDGSGDGASYVLTVTLHALLRLLAPITPYVTEQIYRHLFAKSERDSIHRAAWPTAEPWWADEQALASGELLLAVASSVRRYKSEHGLSLGAELAALELASDQDRAAALLRDAVPDLASVSRAREIRWETSLSGGTPVGDGALTLRIVPLTDET